MRHPHARLVNLLTLNQIDYLNASVVKVLQVGEDRNVLKELNMTSNEYNWVQSIYFVSPEPLDTLINY